MAFLLVVRRHTAQKLFLLIASYYFYAYWDWRFLSLILISTVIDFTVGQALGRTEATGKRRALLVLSLASNLGILGFFKYFNFFVESLQVALEPLGIQTQTLYIILPIGISFYTFQTLSYTIDVYRRELAVCHSLLDFALFVAFFPQLVAGPIVRAAEFLPQLQTPPVQSWDRTLSGFRQFAFGFIKKVFIADRLAMFVDPAFESAGMLSMGTAWLAVAAYAVQIYGDFSGYSDMAIGLARIMGYDLPENFRHPYVATSLRDFWRRWHISLSTWLRDYLYIPLGGNRKGPVRTYINLFLTMLLGGLWHGAAWTFVFWGALHGAALGVNRALEPGLARVHRGAAARLVGALGWVATMLVVLVGWVFFRSQSFNQALAMLSDMFLDPAGAVWAPAFVVFALAAILFTHFFAKTQQWHRLRMLPYERGFSTAVLVILLILVFISRPKGYVPFIYFQF